LGYVSALLLDDGRSSPSTPQSYSTWRAGEATDARYPAGTVEPGGCTTDR